MSRLYGKTYDVFHTSRYISEYKIPKYKVNNKKITQDELIDSSASLDLYLPQDAIDYLINNPIHIIKSPLVPKNMGLLLSAETSNSSIFFKGFNFKEEHKRQLNFFLGEVTSLLHPDKLPESDELPCEYAEVFPFLIEYLYLKENNQEERFLPKYLNIIKANSERYIKHYEAFHKHLASEDQNRLLPFSEYELKEIDDYNQKYESDFLKTSLEVLVLFSSIDGFLQIVDRLKTKEDYKKLIEVLYENPNNNRQEILRDYDIESYGYKRLRKEFDNRRIR